MTDKEHEIAITSIVMLLVKAAGGRIEVPYELMEDMGSDTGRTVLTQSRDPRRRVRIFETRDALPGEDIRMVGEKYGA